MHVLGVDRGHEAHRQMQQQTGPNKSRTVSFPSAEDGELFEISSLQY